MKSSCVQATCKAHAKPDLQFESRQLTFFAGVSILQELFATLDLTNRLRGVFHRRQAGKVFRPQKLFLQLVLQLVLHLLLCLPCPFLNDDGIAVQAGFRFRGHRIEFFLRRFSREPLSRRGAVRIYPFSVEHGDGDALREHNLSGLIRHRDAIFLKSAFHQPDYRRPYLQPTAFAAIEPKVDP